MMNCTVMSGNLRNTSYIPTLKRDKDLISFILIKRIINKIATEIYIKNSELE